MVCNSLLRDFPSATNTCTTVQKLTEVAFSNPLLISYITEPARLEDGKISSWVPSDSEPRITALARASGHFAAIQSASELVLKLRCNKHSTYTERPTSSLIKEVAPLLNINMSRREEKS